MKTPSSDLHDLIQTLSSAEKRYIRRMALNQNTSFLKLLDAVSSQEVYNENELKNTFASEKFVKNLAVNKKYLYDYILNSLVQFRKKEEEFTILEGLSIAQTLLDKELPDQALKMIKKLKNKAKDLGLFTIVQHLIDLQKTTLNSSAKEKEIHLLYEEGKLNQTYISNIHEYWHLYQKSFFLSLNTKKLKTIEFQNAIRLQLTNPQLIDISKAITLESQLYYFQSKAILYSAINEKENSFDHQMKYLEIIEQQPKYFHRFSNQYLLVYNSFLTYALSQGKQNLFEYGVQQIRNMNQLSNFKKSKNLEAKIFSISHIQEMNGLLQFNQLETGLQKLNDIKEGLEHHKNFISLPHRFQLMYQAAYFHFLSGNYAEVLAWIQPLMKFHKTDILQRLLQSARLIHLISNFEQKNFKKGTELIKSTRRYIKQNRKLYESEKALFIYLKNVIDAPHLNKIKVQSMQLLEQLIELKNRPNEKKLYETVNLAQWCEKKVLSN